MIARVSKRGLLLIPLKTLNIKAPNFPTRNPIKVETKQSKRNFPAILRNVTILN